MKIIAHRSGPTVFPEQTIRSALFAKENGADLVEIDVRFTKDKKLAVSHDETQRAFSASTKTSAR